MRSIGTISSAIGFIFLGVWMIIKRMDPNLGMTMLKFWPILFVVLGLELILFGIKKHQERISLNPLIVFVILIYIAVNGFYSFSLNFSSKVNFDSFQPKLFNSFDSKAIDFESSLDSVENNVLIKADNLKVNIVEWGEKKIKIEGTVYFPKNSFYTKYEPTLESFDRWTRIEFFNNELKGVDLTVYVPKIVNLEVVSNNLKFSSSADITKVKIDAKNADVNISKARILSLNGQNINLNAKDISNTVEVWGVNGNANIKGELKNLKLDILNGKISVKDDCKREDVVKNFDVSLNSGIVNLSTKEKDVNVELSLDNGICRLNGEARTNSGIKRILGSGKNKMSIKINSGVINFKSME
ncbi:MAG: hypothetical protein N2486_07435 [Caloramator sp.]|nr:hypothetical protein [Caloramator sp.]